MKRLLGIIFLLLPVTACVHAQSTSTGTVAGKLGAIDSTAPVISGIQSFVTTTSAVIQFSTDELGSTQICRGATGGPYSTCNTEIDTTIRVASHADTFTSLSSATAYYYVVKSTDASGNISTSSEKTFTTDAAGGGLTPTCGETSGTGSANNNTRSIRIPSHWSTTQGKPSISLGSSTVVGSGGSIVIDVTGSDPTSGAPRFYIGGRVNLDVADNTADGNYTITNLSSTTITVSGAYTGTTGTGTVKAIMYADLAEGSSLVDPQFGCTMTKLINGSEPSYSGWNAINQSAEYYLAYDLTAGTFKIIKLSDRSVTCSTSNMVTAGVFGEGANPRFGKTAATKYVIYFSSFNSNVLKKISNFTSSCTTTANLHTFSSYTAIDIGGGEGDIQVTTGGDEVAAIRGCSVSYTCSSGTRDLFLYNITTDTQNTVRNISADHADAGGPGVDNYRPCPDSKMVYQTNTTMYLLNSDGTLNRQVTNTNFHISACVSSGANIVVVADAGGTDSLVTTSPNCEPGYYALNVATSAATCLWNKSNSSASGGPCNNVATYSCNQNGHINVSGNDGTAILTIDNDNFINANEASLASGWDAGVARGDSEVIACSLDGSGCWRLAHLRRGGGGSYRKLPKCSSSFTSGVGDAPKYVVCAVDWRDGSGDAGTDTIIITVR